MTGKSMTRKKICFLISLFAAGLFFIVFDFYITTGLHYPEPYKNDSRVIGEYQYYNIHTFYGATCTYKTADEIGEAVTGAGAESAAMVANAEFVDQVFFKGIRMDLFSDTAGLIMILVVCMMMKKYNRSFTLAASFGFSSVALFSVLNLLPFLINGMALCNLSLGVGIAYTMSQVLTAWYCVKGFTSLIDTPACRDERKWLSIAKFIYLVLSIMILLLAWLDIQSLTMFFMVVHVMDVICVFLLIRRVEDFLLEKLQNADAKRSA